MEINKETSESRGGKNGHKAVGTSAVQLCQKFPCDRGVLVRCPGSSDLVPNVAPVFFGFSSAVTADYDEGTGGMPVCPGESLVIPCDDPSQIFCVSSGANQDVGWMGI